MKLGSKKIPVNILSNISDYMTSLGNYNLSVASKITELNGMSLSFMSD